MRPFSQSDGHDGPGLIDELVPGLAAQSDDFLIGFEDAVGEPVLSDVLPDIFGRIEFGRAWRQSHEGDIAGHAQLVGHVPSGLIEQDEGMRAGRDMDRDLIEVKLHHGGVAAGQDETGRHSARRTDGTEDIG